MNTVCGHWVNFDIISVEVEINHLIGGYKAIFKGPIPKKNWVLPAWAKKVKIFVLVNHHSIVTKVNNSDKWEQIRIEWLIQLVSI